MLFIITAEDNKPSEGIVVYLKLFVNSYGYNANPGSAELPVLEELIIIPFGAEASINILNQEEEIISLSDYDLENMIFPSQPSISKSVNAEQVPFYFNEEYYSRNSFNETDLVKIELLGKMRGQQLARLSVSPFKYNPTTNELKITTKIEVKINFKNIDIVEHKLNQQKYFQENLL